MATPPTAGSATSLLLSAADSSLDAFRAHTWWRTKPSIIELTCSGTSSWLKWPAPTVKPLTTVGSHCDIRCGGVSGGGGPRWGAGTLQRAGAGAPAEPQMALLA